MTQHPISDLIESAISREEEAYRFYMDMYEKIDDPNIKDTLRWIADEEKHHKAFLVDYRNGKYTADTPLPLREITNYKIAEHKNEPDTRETVRIEDVYLVAAHREMQSHKFYSELADLHPEGKAKQILLKMALEELKHKEKMEYLYANTAFPQTSGG